jgi:hypothetical protein
MLLPHERDESADKSAAQQAPKPEMKRAEDDLAKGREDTDCRSQPPLSQDSTCARESPREQRKE